MKGAVIKLKMAEIFLPLPQWWVVISAPQNCVRAALCLCVSDIGTPNDAEFLTGILLQKGGKINTEVFPINEHYSLHESVCVIVQKNHTNRQYDELQCIS